MLTQLKTEAEKAQAELAAAEIVLLEAQAAVGKLAGESFRLNAAVAALSGEPPPADAPAKPFVDESREEFEKSRVKKAKAREKKKQEDNPLAHVKCGGCGKKGTLVDTVLTTANGGTVRMLVCGSCGNQIMQ